MTTDIRVRFGLSKRERAILRLVVQGDTQTAIAQLLGLSGTALVRRRVSGMLGIYRPTESSLEAALARM